MRLGLIGCGRWGHNYVQAAREAGNCAVTHVAGATWPQGVEAVPSREWRRYRLAWLWSACRLGADADRVQERYYNRLSNPD